MFDDVHCVTSVWPYPFQQQTLRYQCINCKIPKHTNLNIGCIDSEIVENSGSDQKSDCLRKMKRWVLCLCMILKLCDSNPTTGKQRALEINQNQ